MSSSQNSLNSALMLLTTAGHTHLLSEIKRSDEKDVDTRDSGDLLHILNTRPRLDLDSHGNTVIGTIIIIGPGVNAGH